MNLSQFEQFDLSPELLKALDQKGYVRPTAIQTKAIPAAMEERDVLGSAPTGTGKTVAFLLPALQHLLDYPRRKPGPPRVLVLTPTRELAMQVAEQAQQLAQFTRLDIATITGGVAYQNHGEVFNSNQDLVVATPGRLLQYIKEENFDCRSVEILIFDEADRMLQMGFGQDAEKIAAETRWRKQTLLFSATLEGKLLTDFAERLLNDPVKAEAQPSRRERKKINQWYYHADSREHKIKLLARFVETEQVSRIGRTARAGKKGTAVSFVEAHDYKLLGKIKRYTEEILKARILEGLEPRTKAPKDGEIKSVSKKQKMRIKEKREEKKKVEAKKKVKIRHKDTKNIGKRRKPSGSKEI